MLRTIYSSCAKVLAKKENKLVIDVVLAAAAGYYTLKKPLDISFSRGLSLYVTNEGVPWVTYPLYGLICYAVLGKVLLLVAEAFPGTRVKATELDGLNHCCLRINNEISRHIDGIAKHPAGAATRFTTEHHFEENVALVVQTLAEQLRSTLHGAARNRDIFISVYVVPAGQDLTTPRNELTYLTHFPAERDLVRSRLISLDERGAFKNYECVKCINAEEDTRLDFDCSEYEKTPAKRHKSVKHYIGMKLKCNNTLLGFLNVELHNKRFFASEDEMVDYVERQLVAFRYLLEYQFLKRVFFNSVVTKLLKP